jgi:hypothetical protein
MSDFLQVSKFSKRAEEHNIHFICIVDSGMAMERGVVLQPLAAEYGVGSVGRGKLKF